MPLTISDIVQMYTPSLQCVAGSLGLQNEVREVAILDYELQPEVSSKFYRNNFYENQLVVSSFLYAKDDPTKLVDAIRYLSENKVSGLVIKNVFNLNLTHGMLRMADARNFPILISQDQNFFIDEFIIRVHDLNRNLDDCSFVFHNVKRLLSRNNPTDSAKIIQTTFPYLEDLYFVALATHQQNSSQPLPALDLGSTCYNCHGEGLHVWVCSAKTKQQLQEMQDQLRHHISPACMPCFSSIKDQILSMRSALLEAMWTYTAKRIVLNEFYHLTTYVPRISCINDLHELGSFLVCLGSLSSQPVLEQHLSCIRSYDHSHQSELLRSLFAFALTRQDIHQAAEILAVNDNTLRYRLKKVLELLGEYTGHTVDIQEALIYFQLDFAQRILEESYLA